MTTALTISSRPTTTATIFQVSEVTGVIEALAMALPKSAPGGEPFLGSVVNTGKIGGFEVPFTEGPLTTGAGRNDQGGDVVGGLAEARWQTGRPRAFAGAAIAADPPQNDRSFGTLI
jgi:hypothetical protein